MDASFLSPFFLAGLLGGVFFFLTAAFVGLSLFAEPSGKKKLLRAQSIVLCFVTVFLLWLSADLWQSMLSLLDSPEPMRITMDDWGKKLVSILVLSISVVFGSLMTAFGWVRAGNAGNGVRSVLWALIGVRIVISAVSMTDLLASASGFGDEIIPDGELAQVSQPVMDGLQSSLIVWAWVVVTAFAISVVATVFLRKEEPNA